MDGVRTFSVEHDEYEFGPAVRVHSLSSEVALQELWIQCSATADWKIAFFPLWREAAHRGSTSGMVRAAICYTFGLRAVLINHQKAVRLAEGAHEHGTPGSAWLLARALF